jgi:hypothetical protein
MSISEPSERKGFAELSAPGEIKLLAIIAIGFGLLHLLTALLLVPPPPRPAAPSLERMLGAYD